MRWQERYTGGVKEHPPIARFAFELANHQFGLDLKTKMFFFTVFTFWGGVGGVDPSHFGTLSQNRTLEGGAVDLPPPPPYF